MWARVLSALLGAWLMAAPDLLGLAEPARTNDHVVGPLVVCFSIVAISGVTRPLRWVNLPLGAWLVAAPWLLGFGWTATANDLLVGLAVAALARVRGEVEDMFGGGWSAVWSGSRPERLQHVKEETRG